MTNEEREQSCNEAVEAARLKLSNELQQRNAELGGPLPAGEVTDKCISEIIARVELLGLMISRVPDPKVRHQQHDQLIDGVIGGMVDILADSLKFADQNPPSQNNHPNFTH